MGEVSFVILGTLEVPVAGKKVDRPGLAVR
jgi:hypothetical protein